MPSLMRMQGSNLLLSGKVPPVHHLPSCSGLVWAMHEFPQEESLVILPKISQAFSLANQACANKHFVNLYNSILVISHAGFSTFLP